MKSKYNSFGVQEAVMLEIAFERYLGLSVDDKIRFCRNNIIKKGSAKGIYNPQKCEVTFVGIINPFTNKNLVVKKKFKTDNVIEIDCVLAINKKCESPENILDIISAKQIKKESYSPAQEVDGLPIQSKRDAVLEKQMHIEENKHNRSYAATKKERQVRSLLNKETIYKYNFEIEFFYYYYPKHNKKHDENSRRIIDMKNGLCTAIDWASELLVKELPDDHLICIVPSSKKGENSSMNPVMLMVESKKSINYTHVFERIANAVSKAKNHGERTPANEYRTLSLKDGVDVKGKNVILVDDVCTTGCSLYACKTLLLKNGAKNVRCIVIGRTIH